MESERNPRRFHIPANISQEHILQALKEIDEKSYPEKLASTKYDLIYNSKSYPPKYVISLANEFANGTRLEVSEFSGGEQKANKFLQEIGFEICQKYEDESFSWKIYSNSIVTKKTDLSVFNHNATGIPKEKVRDFFSVKNMQPGDEKTIILWVDSTPYKTIIEWQSYGSQITRLVWDKDFASVIQQKFPTWFDFFHKGGKKSNDTPLLKFIKRLATDEYDVEFIEDSHPEEGQFSITQDEPILTKYQEYTRKDIHDIFDKNSRFTPRSGKWGLRGIISHPSIPNDFIFFVTFGHKEGKFSFDEFITRSGILTWQSEPKQKLRYPVIQKLIRHNSKKNSIHLFLRTHEDRDYTYLGLLAYIDHNPDQEQPVRFTWQILDWHLEQKKAEQMGLQLKSDEETPIKISDTNKFFIQTNPPNIQQTQTVSDSKTRNYVGRKVDHITKNLKNTETGDDGEYAVIEIEKDLLTKAKVPHLIEKIEHIAKTKGDGLGYDILSVTPEDEQKFIEVKTTLNGESEPFFLTQTELDRSKQSADNYYLYRLYDFDKTKNRIKYYILEGDLTNQLDKKPIQYSCTPFKINTNDNKYIKS